MTQKWVFHLLFAGLCCVGFAQGDALVFSATGDVPYTPAGRVRFVQDIADFNRLGRSPFLIHLGDIKSGSTPCDEAVYVDVSMLMKTIAVPTFIIPGDNEWNDCTNPDDAWDEWVEYFGNFEENWPAVPGASVVVRPESRPENFAFTLSGVLFVGINLPGGRVQDQAEWDLRLPQDAAFIAERMTAEKDAVRAAVVFAQANPNATHEKFVTPFRAAAGAFGKPVLFLHGDGHTWINDHPWAEQNIERVQIVEGNLASPLEVTVTTHPEQPFIFEREPFGGRAEGDFDKSGCADIDDFLFLLDNWHVEVGGTLIDTGDFLRLLDYWKTGAGC